MSKQALQLIIVPLRPTPTDAEIDADLAPAFKLLLSTDGLIGSWQGKKFEDRYTRVYLLLWESLAASHAFFTGKVYKDFNDEIQPAMNGRKIQWQQHALLDVSSFASRKRLDSILSSPAVEVALTKVVEGGVYGYYEGLSQTVVPILEEDPGCDGYFVSPQIENPQDQIFLINWKSVNAHHEDFEKKPGFKACIDALSNYYAVFVVPWHIVDLKPCVPL